MSQHHQLHGDHKSPSLRPHRPPPSVDHLGFQSDLPHSSSSIYDDPEEFATLRELDGDPFEPGMTRADEAVEGYSWEAAAFSSPTPSSSGGNSLSSHRPPSMYTAASSSYTRAPPMTDERQPPQPVFARTQKPSDSRLSAFRCPALTPAATSARTLFPPSVVRPDPVRPMPLPRSARTITQVPHQEPHTFQQSRVPSYSSSSFPIPSRGGITSRHGPEALPVTRSAGLGWRDDPNQGSFNGTSSRFKEIGRDDADTDEYLQGREYDSAIMSINESHHQANPRETDLYAASRKIQEPAVQYYDDLEQPSGVVRNAVGLTVARKASSTNRVRKGDIKLIPVSRLPDAFRSIWRFGVFNAVQSCCFDSVYGTDKNVVVSAPTGAGKTVLFELAIIRYFTGTTSNQAKVLYVAPTKSLCAERALDWKRKFESAMGWKVVELTGDSEIGSMIWREVASSRIIVTTPEKWDAITRRWHDHDRILSELRLFCVDEVHSVGSDIRGAVLEVVVSRMKTLGTSTRFVAVSATVPNIQDVADWLRNSSDDEQATVFEFGDEFRPCPLQKIVYGYNSNMNDFAFAKSLNPELFKLIKKHSSGNPVLIFCSTRKGCLEAAEQLVKDYIESLNSVRNRQTLAWPKPPRAAFSINDKQLATLIENGVSIHHAGMDQNDRKLVEKLFLDGKISVICSTSTLAVGVNLPARMVIIRGTKGYNDGRLVDYADMDLLQMIGRAGRPQFDQLGVAVIMTGKESQQKYENLVNAHKNLESCLHKNLTEHINSEISLRTITDVDSALRWLRSTFLFVRISKNPPFYAISNGDQVSPDARLEEICVEAVTQLVKEGIVAEHEDHSLSSNEYGEIMARFYISLPTLVALKSMPRGANMRSFIETLSKAEELSSFRLRQGEKSVLSKVNKSLRFPVEKVATTADRVMILIQVVLEGIPGHELRTDTVNPLHDVTAIWSSAVRIAKAMFDLSILRSDASARLAMELLRSLHGRCWDGSSFILRQLKGIGEKGYKALVDAGIRSFGDVAAASPDRLELILNRKPPYGSTLVKQATSFPTFQVELSIEHEAIVDAGVEVELQIGIALTLTKPPAITKKGVLNLYASLLILTSDNHFIEYRRCPLAEIAKGAVKPFSISVILVKPSQRVVASVSCDLLAGSEVRAEVKPATSSADFPIPTLASEPENALEEFRAPVTSKALSKPFSVPKPVSRKRSLSDSEDQAETLGTRMRGDGKYDCKHQCGDKTTCKHLCCREGLDKPPRETAAPKKRKLSKTDSTSFDRLAGNPANGKTQSRIPMKESTGVTLAQDATGKVVTRTKPSIASVPVRPVATLDRTNSKSKVKHVTTLTSNDPAVDADDDSAFDLPSPDQLMLDACSRTLKDKRKKKKVVVLESLPRSRTASPEFFSLDGFEPARHRSPPPSETIFDKKKPALAAFGRSSLALKDKARVSFKVFDSSDDEDEGKGTVTLGTAFDEPASKVDDDDELLFRDIESSSDPSDDGFDNVVHNVGIGTHGAVDDPDTALAIARSFEDVASPGRASGGGVVENQREAMIEGTRERNHGQIEEGWRDQEEDRVGGIGSTGEEIHKEGDDADDDDDGFDAWLANNVIIKD